jgi:hypothetical protein
VGRAPASHRVVAQPQACAHRKTKAPPAWQYRTGLRQRGPRSRCGGLAREDGRRRLQHRLLRLRLKGRCADSHCRYCFRVVPALCGRPTVPAARRSPGRWQRGAALLAEGQVKGSERFSDSACTHPGVAPPLDVACGEGESRPATGGGRQLCRLDSFRRGQYRIRAHSTRACR